jgi:hypothetical protein
VLSGNACVAAGWAGHIFPVDGALHKKFGDGTRYAEMRELQLFVFVFNASLFSVVRSIVPAELTLWCFAGL